MGIEPRDRRANSLEFTPLEKLTVNRHWSTDKATQFGAFRSQNPVPAGLMDPALTDAMDLNTNAGPESKKTRTVRSLW